MGRRPTSKRTPEREAAILKALRAGNTRRAAAAFAEIDQNTFYRWLQEGTFRDAVEKAEAEAEVRYAAQVAKAAGDGTWQAAAWWLERRRPEDYARRDRRDVTVEIRQLVDRAAIEAGIDPREVFAEVEAILAGGDA